ncbi:MAG: chromate transporter, partial [Alistipes sp.]|nr:chromate transporter [Alistipes sp.]
PIALNTAVFVGYKMKSYAGALAAVMGVVVPSFTIILLIAIFFSDVRDNVCIDAAFRGMRPAVVALIVAPIVGLTRGMSALLMAVAAAVAVAVWYWGFSPVWLLVAGAAAGALWAAYAGKEVRR